MSQRSREEYLWLFFPSKKGTWCVYVCWRYASKFYNLFLCPQLRGFENSRRDNDTCRRYGLKFSVSSFYVRSWRASKVASQDACASPARFQNSWHTNRVRYSRAWILRWKEPCPPPAVFKIYALLAYVLGGLGTSKTHSLSAQSGDKSSSSNPMFATGRLLKRDGWTTMCAAGKLQNSHISFHDCRRHASKNASVALCPQ